jgi:hypothetical protein
MAPDDTIFWGDDGGHLVRRPDCSIAKQEF